MSFVTDMALFDLENQFAAVIGLLVTKGTFTMDEYEAVLAEVKRLKEEKYAKKKGTNA